MTYCKECGKEVRDGDIYCRQCGARQDAASAGQGPASGATVAEDELALFVGKNADIYLPKFRKFMQGGAGSFSVTWHWPAFFFTFWWMIYRKMYGWALLILLTGWIPCAGLLLMIGFGMSANYLYFNHARKKLLALKATAASEVDRGAAIGRAGGVNNVAIVIVPLVIIAIVGVLAAIAIPQLAGYRQKAADLQAKRELQEACGIGLKLFAENPGKTELEPDEFLHAGLVRTPEVEMTLLDGRKDTFSISAKHTKGSTLYGTDRRCFLTEERQRDN
jgi:hypothetical protein